MRQRDAVFSSYNGVLDVGATEPRMPVAVVARLLVVVAIEPLLSHRVAACALAEQRSLKC
jgi:hypothetical protein